MKTMLLQLGHKYVKLSYSDMVIIKALVEASVYETEYKDSKTYYIPVEDSFKLVYVSESELLDSGEDLYKDKFEQERSAKWKAERERDTLQKEIAELKKGIL